MARLKPKAHNLVDPDQQKLFLVHRDKYAVLKKRMDDASNAMRTFTKTVTGDGFNIKMIKDAILLGTPEGEAQLKQDMANRLMAAAYIGADIGDQLSLFLDNPRTPAVDRAFREGTTAAMENKAANPKYDPSTEQHAAYMQGYHEEQERQLKKGIKKLDTKKAAANAKGGKPAGKRGRPKKDAAAAPAASETRLIKKADKDAAAAARAPKPDSAPPRRPTAVPATRASMAAPSKKAREEAESYFTKAEPQGNA